ncbi:MAG: lipopolysaccharide kinase InaA family protein [Pseudomonadota bacterium]
MAAEQESQQLHRWAPDLAEARHVPGWREVDSSGTARVAFHPDHHLYFKAFMPRSPWERVKGWLRGTRAARARTHNEQLRKYGFETPRDIAWGRLTHGREYQYSTAVPGDGVTHWLRRELTGREPADLLMKRRLLRELGRFVGRLHHAGFVHGDLRPSNVLAQYSGERFNFALIDNERTSWHRQIPGKLLLKNLMQLNMLLSSDLTVTDRWRFFQAWRRQMPELSELEARVLAVEAYQWARRRLQAKGLK